MLVASKAALLKNYVAISAWIFDWIFDGMPRKEVSTFQFVWCSIWKPGNSNFWVKIGLVL